MNEKTGRAGQAFRPRRVGLLPVEGGQEDRVAEEGTCQQHFPTSLRAKTPSASMTGSVTARAWPVARPASQKREVQAAALLTGGSEWHARDSLGDYRNCQKLNDALVSTALGQGMERGQAQDGTWGLRQHDRHGGPVSCRVS